MKQQLQRIICICEMIEAANNMIASLKKDLNNYNNPSPEFDKIRLMLDKSWIEGKLSKYEGVKNRLVLYCNEMIKKVQVQPLLQMQQAA